MGPEKMMSSGMWIFPMIICVSFMLIMIFVCFRGRIGQGFFTNQQQGMKNTDEESPLDILKKRYAKGELSRQEFEQQKQDLLS